MGTVLRLHKEADNNIKDWVGGTNRGYGSDVINQIQDPGGARADKEITSIPSPFARIDLACSAFKFVADNDVDGKTIYHKLVSDCLDIGEIFFNFDKLADKLEILVWDKKKELQRLMDSAVKEHKILGNTLKMYLEQDAEAYNFDKMDKIFMLRYKGKGKKGDMDIIGATSPRTLFFSSANDLQYCSEQLRPGGKDRPFDDEYTPLFKRDFEYQKYLYSLRLAYGETRFASDFPELNDYMQESLRHLNDEQKDALEKLDNNSITEFSELSYDSNVVEVIGLPLHKGNSIAPDEMKSDFFIKSSIYNGKKPLVLPVKVGNKYSDLRYVKDSWQDENAAPYSNSTEMDSRILPYTADKYPYLTISDFLTPSIILMPYQLNDTFFNGNLKDEEKSFLLPLKDTFFKFFTPKELMEPMPDGKNMIDMRAFGAVGVEVTLRIPIQKGRYIEYIREYRKTDDDVLESKNEGKVIERKFGLGIIPPVNFKELSANVFYRIAFFSKSKNSRLSFAGEKDFKEKQHSVRSEAGNTCSIESYVLEENLNRVYIEIDKVKNVAIPVLKTQGTAAKYTFAVDFGTTNTHIEYSIDGGRVSNAFDIQTSESQIHRMHNNYKGDKDIEYAFLDAFIPNTIGSDDDYAFPIRTVFAESTQIDYRKANYCLADGNIPFRYEKARTPQYNRIKSDLKWSNDDAQLVELYLDNLFLLMRNKVILGGGGLGQTKIVWFYPLSMTRARCNRFSDIWKKLYKKYFGENVDNNLIMMSESVAPYYYYKRDVGAKSNVVTIDIGGGTTDVFVVEENKPKMLSSFRFAANAVFGDGYNFPISDNGFVNTFRSDILGALEANKLTDLKDALASIEKYADCSTDIIAFYFSLASNKALRKKDVPIDFLEMLAKNDKLKYSFIVFYGAILYYVAITMKSKGLALPQTLAFSGNGSKTLKVLSTDKKTLAKYAQLIFEKVYDTKYSGTSLEVIYENEPKLATCKGGLSCNEALNYDEVENLMTSLLGVDQNAFTAGKHYNEISDSDIQSVASHISDFVDFLFSVNDDNRNFFVDCFGADASIIRNVKGICKEDLIEFTKQGLEKKNNELKQWGAGDDADIEETLFFYPIVAMLSNLARKIK